MNVLASQASSASAARASIARHTFASSVAEATSELAIMRAASKRVKLALSRRGQLLSMRDEVDASHFFSRGPTLQRIVNGAALRAACSVTRDTGMSRSFMLGGGIPLTIATCTLSTRLYFSFIHYGQPMSSMGGC